MLGISWQYAVGIMMVLLGLWSLIEHGAIGWLLFGLSGPMIMVSIWWEKDLKTAEISKNPKTIDDVMAADVFWANCRADRRRLILLRRLQAREPGNFWQCGWV